MDHYAVRKTLDALAEAQNQRDILEIQKAEMIESVLTPEIKAALEDIDDEFSGKFTVIDEDIAAMTAQVKDAVVDLGESVKGAQLYAIWNKGRVSWDTKALDGYAAAHPEIEQFRKVGKPSVSIRKV